jgi:hypothetical protein
MNVLMVYLSTLTMTADGKKLTYDGYIFEFGVHRRLLRYPDPFPQGGWSSDFSIF